MISDVSDRVDVCSGEVALYFDQLATWKVAPDLLEMRSRYARAINLGVLERCAEAHERLDRVSGLGGSELTVALKSKTWTTPEIAFAYHVELARPRSAPHVAVERALRALHAVAVQPEAPPRPQTALARLDAPSLVYALGVFERDHRRDGRVSALQLTAPSAAERAAVTCALAALDSGWREMADAVRALVQRTYWCRAVSGAGLRSASLPQAFGAIFVQAGASPAAVLEALVHESTHLDVVMRTAFDPLVTNMDARGPSPFRHQPRPLNRVLHAAVVSARVSHALRRCAHLLDAEDRRAAAARSGEAIVELSGAFETLARHGRFTPTGERLIDELAEYLVSQHRRTGPGRSTATDDQATDMFTRPSHHPPQ